MSTKFNQCPNCKKRCGGFLANLIIYECKRCGAHYCRHCGGDRCPDCGAKEKKQVGNVK